MPESYAFYEDLREQQIDFFSGHDNCYKNVLEEQNSIKLLSS